MLHFSLMKKRIFVLIACFIGAASVSHAENVPLDSVKTFFDDGSVARIYTVRKGTDIREGVSLSYHPNGKVAIEAPYKNGKLDGVFRSYYENGNLWQTAGFVDGNEDGASTDYYESGLKKSREIYDKGLLNGMSEEWNEKGVVWRRIPYVKGRVDGVAKIFDELGALKEEMTFEKGLRHGPYRRYSKGVKVFEAEFEKNRCVKNCDF